MEKHRVVKLQGASPDIPIQVPALAALEIMYQDYQANYRGFEKWNQEQRKKSLQTKLASSVSRTFQTVRDNFRAPLETLVDKIEAPILQVDPATCAVQVDIAIEGKTILYWTLDGSPVQVRQHDSDLCVETDGLLRTGQKLACHCMVADRDDIHDRLCQLWLPRWQKHLDTPDAQWDRIIAFANAYLPKGSYTLPSWSLADWQNGVHNFRERTATGPDGWARADIAFLPDRAAHDIVNRAWLGLATSVANSAGEMS